MCTQPRPVYTLSRAHVVVLPIIKWFCTCIKKISIYTKETYVYTIKTCMHSLTCTSFFLQILETPVLKLQIIRRSCIYIHQKDINIHKRDLHIHTKETYIYTHKDPYTLYHVHTLLFCESSKRSYWNSEEWVGSATTISLCSAAAACIYTYMRMYLYMLHI